MALSYREGRQAAVHRPNKSDLLGTLQLHWHSVSSMAAVSPREHDPHNTKTLLWIPLWTAWHPCFTRRHGADRSPEALVTLSPPSCCHLFSLIRYLGGLTRGQGRPSQPVIRRFAASLIRPPNLASHIHLRGLDENVSGYTAERAAPSIVPSGPQPSSALWGPEARGGGPLILNRHRDGRMEVHSPRGPSSHSAT